MPKLIGKLGEWDLPFVHQWKDRGNEIRFNKKNIINKETKIVTIGSCFAEELANAMSRLGLNGEMHPNGLFYNSKSILQEFERIFTDKPITSQEPFWNTSKGWIHPFKSYYDVFKTEDELRKHSDILDKKADNLFKNADFVVVTLGLIECWKNPNTGNFFRQIPPPEVFSKKNPEFYRLSVEDMISDLSEIRRLIYQNTSAKLIVTVSPVPLHSTFTPLDVRIANIESKSRIRAAVSEFVQKYEDINYFHSYEIIATAERMSDFMLEDGRHVQKRAVDYILNEFLKMFGDEKIIIPNIDKTWITKTNKFANRPNTKKPLNLRMKLKFLRLIKKIFT